MTNQEIVEKLKQINVYKTKLKIYIKNHFPEIYQSIYENTNFLDISNKYHWKITFAERLYCIRHNITKRIFCNTCKKEIVKFKTDSNCYRKHCSNSCSTLDDEVILKKQQTNIKKYGQTHWNNNEKSRKTRFQKNNGKWHSSNFGNIVKEKKEEKYNNANWNNQNLRKKTCNSLYGVDHPMKCKKIIDKIKNDFAKKHNGITCAFQLPEVIEKTKIGNRKKSWRCIQNSQLVEPVFSLEDYLKVKDLNEEDCLTFKCKKCGTVFKSKWDNGCCKQCPTCYPELHGISHMEIEVFEYLRRKNKNSSIEIINDGKINRSIISPKELDIVIMKRKKPVIAIEFDGLYWHSEAAGTSKNALLEKTDRCNDKDISLIHIFENEWLIKKDIVKSRLKNLLGIYEKTIFARKCEIREVNSKLSREFQERTHIQGAVNAKVNLGLFYDNKLIALMTFVKSRFNKKYEWELLRFCTELGYHIPGGAGKLLKHFERNYNPKSLISYADRRWSQGKLYKALGFELGSVSKPNYWYLKPSNTSILENRIKFQKHKLPKLLKNFNENLSEVENMRNNGYTRIFDCGNLVFVKEYAQKNSRNHFDLK